MVRNYLENCWTSGFLPQNLRTGVVRHHRALLWNNIGAPLIQTRHHQLNEEEDIYWVTRRSDIFRGGDYRLEHCGEVEAMLDENGLPVPVDDGGILREGWIWVSPFWDPDNPIKVCAYDAQTVEYTERGTDCKSLEAQEDPLCGCGPELQWCWTNKADTMDIVIDSINSQVDIHIREMILQDRSYTELLTSDKVYLNGPLVHFFNHQLNSAVLLDFQSPPFDLSLSPDLAFTNTDTWVETPGVEGTSGILTLPAYLLRFMSNRARANRFNSAFLCDDFIGPEEGLPEAEDEVYMPDLTQRIGCNYCHARLEPMAAYWGRWTESGTSWLDPAIHPAYDPVCAWCGEGNATCAATCKAYYVVDGLSGMELEWLGWLKSYQFLNDRYHPHVEEGPQLIVEKGIASGQVPACVVENGLSGLLGRELLVEDDDLKAELTEVFLSSGLSYRALVRAMVESDAYGRLP